MKKALSGFLILSVVGCASIKVSPPVYQSFEKGRTYHLSYETVWTRAVDWFAGHNVTIDKIEKSSGLITAKYLIEVNQIYLDCGDIKVSGILGDPIVDKYGTLNVTVRSVSDQETKVNVNFFGEYKFQANDAWDGRLIINRGRCVSTGNLEKSILDYIRN